MAFLSPLLLAGAALIGIPIVLHLRRRRDPVRVEFPALRLLKRNRRRTETQLRIRRWVLLALRCVLLAALAVALARPLLRPPSVADGAGAAEGPAGEGVALAIVIDNGPNTAYQSRNKTRLDEARDLAGVLLEKLPATMPVVLSDRSPAGAAVSIEARAASARVERLAISNAVRPLAAVFRDAVARLATTAAARREAYVFTDLSQGAWDEESQQTIAAVLDEHPGVALKLVDIGVAEPRNAAIDSIETAGESIALGQPLELRASITLAGEWRDPLTVQLWVDSAEGPMKRDERQVDASSADSIDFIVAGLAEGTATGFVRVVGGDSAPADDVRHFAVHVRRPPKVLIVAPRVEDAVFLYAAIDPPIAEASAARRFEAEVISYDRWPRQQLAAYEAVLLCDPPPEIERGRGWRRLYDHATGGGGVGLFFGREATLEAFNSPDAQAVMPAPLAWRSRAKTHLQPTSYNHPAIAALAPYAESIAWPLFPVFQRWDLGDLREGATVVASYADGAAAIVEQRVGRGRVVTLTTSVSDRLDRPEPWNLLPTAEDAWPFVLLADSITSYLTGAGQARLEYQAGETVVSPLPMGFESGGYVLQTPTGESVRESVPPGATELRIASAANPGAYRVRSGDQLDRSFVINLDPATGHLKRVPFDQLADSIGKDRIGLVSDREELVRAIDLGRVGRELYGWVLALAAAALAGEQWVSSRYYRQTPEEGAPRK